MTVPDLSPTPLTVVAGVHEVLAEVTAEHPLSEDARLLQPSAGRPGGDETPAARHQGARHHTAHVIAGRHVSSRQSLRPSVVDAVTSIRSSHGHWGNTDDTGPQNQRRTSGGL